MNCKYNARVYDGTEVKVCIQKKYMPVSIMTLVMMIAFPGDASWLCGK
jgi:hypothetical protein